MWALGLLAWGTVLDAHMAAKEVSIYSTTSEQQRASAYSANQRQSDIRNDTTFFYNHDMKANISKHIATGEAVGLKAALDYCKPFARNAGRERDDVSFRETCLPVSCAAHAVNCAGPLL